MDLSLNLKALISQRLVPRKSGSGRCAAVEILLNSPLVSDAVRRAMVQRLSQQGIADTKVLAAMESVPRHLFVEPGLAQAAADDKFQFERHGYFVADRKDHGVGKLVFNRTTGLKDSWAK
mgnify:CR=1 FL=1